MLEFLIRGLGLGLTYGLLAMPLSLLFVALGTVDFALGTYAVVAAATAFKVGGALGAAAGVVAGIVAACCIAWIHRALGRTAQGDSHAFVMATLAFAIFLQSLLLTTLGKNPFTVNLFTTAWDVGGIRVSPQTAVNLAVGVAALFVLWLVLFRTPLGRAVRAAAVNSRGATLAGIPVQRVRFATFVLAGALSGMAGVLYLYSFGLEFSAGMDLTLAGFGASILFGIQSPLRGFLGGLAIGTVEALSAAYAPAGLVVLIPLVFIFLVLVFTRTTLGVAGRV